MKLPKTYDPKQYEASIYALWESSGAFRPSGKGEPYSIALPPPNANGNLHVGHALMIPLEDILIRYHRMKGYDTVFIPGADHAGFETWVVYERELQKQGKSRFDFSREEIYVQVWDFVEKQRGNMELQLRQLGASLSWEHMVFTLDKKVIDTVYDTFKKMWDDKLIYRGERIVNFCTHHQTSFADIEVVHKNEKSKLWQVAYPLMDRVGEIVVATTRPETMFGDTAIAVHPNDERYKELVGTNVMLPIVNREIPIIADEAIDPSFGTGAVKVTPAHDPTDFEIGSRHNLPIVSVIGHDGHMTHDVPPLYREMPVSEARQRILYELNDMELMRGEQDYEHSVGHCYKCGTVIQPMVKDQWFVHVRPLAQNAVAALEDETVKFVPKNQRKVLIQYLNGLKDWNISRQIPWGIPIPAFQNIDQPHDWIFDTRVDQPTIVVDGKTYRREEDTFDTWFSSGQWPFITTDYLQKGELSKYYPLSVMETGYDILYQWVARMLMLGLYRTGEVPFKNVYLHGLILDANGQKMSKSKGNVINPQEVIDQFGSDALRMGIVTARSAGQSQAFSSDKVVAGRNFCNKLWNIARFIEDKVGDSHQHHAPKPTSLADHWIMHQLNQAASQIGQMITDYRFAEAVDLVYHTIWDDVADWYIEASKQNPNKDVLIWALETCLKIAHPFAPFVTETIWQTLQWQDTPLISADWPKKATCSKTEAAKFEKLQQLVSEVRFIANELGSKQTLLYKNDDLIAEQAEQLRHLANLVAVQKISKARGLRLAIADTEAWLDLSADQLYEHQTKLELRLVETRTTIKRLESRLASQGYVNNAPKQLVDETKEHLKQKKQLEERLVRELEVIG